MPVEVLSGRVFVVLTGASRGIGETIAVEFSQLLAQGSQIVMLARNVDGLKKTAEKMSKHVKIDYESVDLSVATADILDGILRKYLGSEGTKNFDRAVIVHNAASTGDMAKSTIDMIDYVEWRDYFDLNVFSPAVFNSVFMKIFTDETKIQRLVINITSLCAIEPMKSVVYYSTGKAAREMYFKIFAAEFPQVNVLNWSPGPVETDMFNVFVNTAGDPEIRAQFREMQEKKDVLSTEQSVNRLIMVLKDQKYKSGDHVDYYDQL